MIFLLNSSCLASALNFTGDWAEARVKANATYKSFSNAVVSAEVGLHVGLYGINITLKGEQDESSTFLVRFLEPRHSNFAICPNRRARIADKRDH